MEEEEVAEGLSGALRSVLPRAGLEKGSCQLDGEASQLLTETQDFTCFSSLAQGVCAVPVTNTVSCQAQAVCPGRPFALSVSMRRSLSCFVILVSRESMRQVSLGFGIPVVSLRGNLGG